MLNTQVYIQNNLQASIPISTSVTPALAPSLWSVYANAAGPVGEAPAYWMGRGGGITDGQTWVFSTALTLGDVPVSLQVQLTGTWLDSHIQIRVTAGGQDSGWSSAATVEARIGAGDGRAWTVRGAFIPRGLGEHDDVRFSVASTVLPQVKHVVVLMMENRSLDNLLGWIYDGNNPPPHVLPAGSDPMYDGLATGTFSNTAPGVNGGEPVFVTEGATAWTVNGHRLSEFNVPNPDPGEEFQDIAEQIGGTMGGFLSNYLIQMRHAGGPDDSARQIMESYAPAQVPVISALARGYAVSDAWHASVPSQTWPNRYFLLAGTCFGHTNNSALSPTHGSTVFDVLAGQNISWGVYSDNVVSLVKVMFWRYWDDETNFHGLDAFTSACLGGTLPAFTFLEPSFGIDFDDYKINLGVDRSYHPPHDLRNGEAQLYEIYQTIQKSPNPEEILFVVLFDEHGGTYDHVEPPTGALPPLPNPTGTDGKTVFGFEQFGVRVPAIVVSPYVRPGTVFRTPSGVPFDHTSVLATVRDWLGLQVAFKSQLPSPRIAAAPTLASVLEAAPVAGDRPVPPPLPVDPTAPAPPESTAMNPLQRSMAVAGMLRATGRAPTLEHFLEAGQTLQALGDVKAVTPPVPTPPVSPSGVPD